MSGASAGGLKVASQHAPSLGSAAARTARQDEPVFVRRHARLSMIHAPIGARADRDSHRYWNGSENPYKYTRMCSTCGPRPPSPLRRRVRGCNRRSRRVRNPDEQENGGIGGSAGGSALFALGGTSWHRQTQARQPRVWQAEDKPGVTPDFVAAWHRSTPNGLGAKKRATGFEPATFSLEG